MMMDGELAGFAIPRLGMGTMALAIEGRPDRDTAIRTIHAGLDAGVRYLDTAWSYYLPSELLLLLCPILENRTNRVPDLGYRCPIHQNRTLRGGILRDAAVGLARNASICRRRAVNTGGWRIRAPKP